MTFIYRSKDGLIGRLYHRFIEFAINSEYIDRIIVFSESEKEFYCKLFNIRPDVLVSEKLGIDEVDLCTRKGDYYLSAGRSNRDYEFLRNNWPDRDRKLRIICDTIEEKDTENITYLKSCHDSEYLKELAECYAVVIPLCDEKISSGQLVILQAKMFGKPVIVTENSTICGYVNNGVDGYIIKKNNEELISAMEKISDPIVYQAVSEEARLAFKATNTIWSMGLRIGTIIKNLS